jgi:alkanesulfonate monooxygenase SsuD/methylene tetrahydromethanopterin reductase-like flavin-dependent oxidoreductase (luciferase family)
VGDRFIIGSPAECAEQIRRCGEATGATETIFRLHWPGMDHATVLKTLRLLGEKVRPLVTS